MLKAIEQYAAAKSSIRSIPSVNEDAKTTSTNKTSLSPVKMDLPDFRETLENAKKSERVNASQDVVINGQNHTVTNKARDLGLPVNDKYLYVLDSQPVTAETIRSLSTPGFETLRKLEPADAIFKYGEKGAHGAFEFTTQSDQGNEAVSQKDAYTVYRKVDVEASFPGGPNAWRTYLQKNLDASIPANEGWKAGTYKIMIQFIVDKEGNIRNVRSINYKDSKTAAACITLISKGPKWIPASQKGKKVSAYRNQPITFVIEEQ